MRLSGFQAPAKSALAGLLALLLLAAATFSVCDGLHRCLHSGDTANHHFCLVCSLAKGQASAVEMGVVAFVVLFSCLFGLRLANAAPVVEADVRLSPSRAPPCR
jgi:hypothetical protein